MLCVRSQNAQDEQAYALYSLTTCIIENVIFHPDKLKCSFKTVHRYALTAQPKHKVIRIQAGTGK